MWHGYQVIALLWFWTILCLILVSVRIYVQISTKFRPWREVLVGFAWLMYSAYVIAWTVRYVKGGLGEEDGSINPASLTESQQLVLNKLWVVQMFTWCIGLSACKAVLLLLFQDFCPRSLHPRLFWLIAFAWALLLFNIFGVNIVWAFLQCYPKPFSSVWTEPHIKVAFGIGCGKGTRLWVSTMEAFAIATDLLVIIIPIIVISRLQTLTTTQKIGAAAMFAIGTVNVVANVIEVAKQFDGSPAVIQGVSEFVNASLLPTALIVVCVPQLRVLGRWWTSSKSKVSQSLTLVNATSSNSHIVMEEEVIVMDDLNRHDGTSYDVEKRQAITPVESAASRTVTY